MYSLFQGDQWTTRLEIGFTALFAAVAAGLLVLLIALTLIILKLGFLLLLVAGPFFLIVGVHPGFGRVVAIRWFEMLVGVLLKQVAVALVLSVLLYCYSLIMSTTDQELPWALKIMMIALVTVAVFIYRKPFQHLFSSVGYGMLGANERAETSWRESAFGFRRVSATATGIVPGTGAARASRWARRTAPIGGGGADGAGTGAAEGGVRATSSDGMSGGPTADSHSAARQWPAAGVGTGRTAPPLPLPTNGAPPTANGGSAGWARGGGGTGAGPRGPAQPPVRTTGPMPAAPTPPPGRRRPHRGHRGRPGPPPPGRRRRRRHQRSPRRRPRRRSGRGPAVGPSSGAGHGTLARQAAAAVCRRRHRARRPWHLRDPRAEPREHGGTRPRPRRRLRAEPPRAERLPGHRLPRSSPAASSPAASPSATAGGANIYQWLPFTAVGPHRRGQDHARLRQRLRQHELHRDEGRLRRQAGRAHHPAGGGDARGRLRDARNRATRTADKQVATGTPTIDSISSFGPQDPPGPPGPPSITFAVTIAQKLASTSGTITSTPEYTITIVSTATGWQVDEHPTSLAG